MRPRLPLGDENKRKSGGGNLGGYTEYWQKASSPRKEDSEGHGHSVPAHCVELARLIDSHRAQLLDSLASHSPSLITDQSLGHYRGWVGRMCFVRNNSDRGQRIVFTANTVAADTG